jgi:hypothetical protein
VSCNVHQLAQKMCYNYIYQLLFYTSRLLGRPPTKLSVLHAITRCVCSCVGNANLTLVISAGEGHCPCLLCALIPSHAGAAACRAGGTQGPGGSA